MQDIKITLDFFKIVWQEMLKSKSLPRILLNYNLSGMEVFGQILDLGSKSDKASYNRFLKLAPNSKITFTDWHEEGENIIKLNLEETFPISAGTYDFITCFNVLEHIYNVDNTIKESYRILKSGGLFIGQTPFLVNYHADPHDYFRYTHETLERKFAEAGFVCERMVYLGFGALSASFALRSHLYPRILRPFFTILFICLDILILKIKKNQAFKYPLGYLYLMRKK